MPTDVTNAEDSLNPQDKRRAREQEWEEANLIFSADSPEDVEEIILGERDISDLADEHAEAAIALIRGAFAISDDEAEQFFAGYGSLALEAYFPRERSHQQELHGKAVVAFSKLSESQQRALREMGKQHQRAGLHRIAGVASIYDTLEKDKKSGYFDDDLNPPLVRAA
ncbi:MAG: hypothetical protein COV10_03955 [Candidatus Vogelbacteria bacterium CG10_big_fil_rev_8_21_14_0_10_51_16]|uniref:Uncharacterized protein n=1 Tax=Candidatus Vogelbacteria bacterium CG10_big_fil_rev_8_21_14_0_10_51_16 TaxID=1975045 RepID=A0A2H0RDL6_9BACT|nr:MAG: hypothetical protein COV10_03955 [Candidatus Vogelbacteria bacterium CG10_big_fil_rev_8_21_14_0_10_51_16]